MRTTIWRDDVVDLVIWNWRPLAVYFDFVMVADHTALSRATVHEATAGAFAVISVQLRVKIHMPAVVGCPVVSFLRRAAYTKRHGERSAEQRDELAPFHSITSSARGEPCHWDPEPLPGGRLILEDQAEQEMHVAAVGSAFRRLGSIGSPHLAQVPYVPSDIRFRAASI
jgi:hypothetical protein